MVQIVEVRFTALGGQYGAEAEIQAHERAEALARLGNAEAAQVWNELGAAVARLRAPAPAERMQREPDTSADR